MVSEAREKNKVSLPRLSTYSSSKISFCAVIAGDKQLLFLVDVLRLVSLVLVHVTS